MSAPRVICVPIKCADQGLPIPCREATCAECGVACWLAETSVLAMADHPGYLVTCVPCALQILHENPDDCAAVATSRVQQQELDAAGIPRGPSLLAELLGVPLVSLDPEDQN